MPVVALIAYLLSATAAATAAGAVPPGRLAEVDAIFAEYDRPGSPGCSVGVVQDGELVFSKGYGLASLEWGIPNGPRTVFDVGSVAKQFTAAVVQLLAADGILSLDDDVRKWIPELFDHGHRVTLRHLIHHTGGLRSEPYELARPGVEVVLSEADELAMLARQRGFDFVPGSAFTYNNSGYVLLAVAAKRASGKSLRQLAGERIFGPLGMADTVLLDDHAEVVTRRASAYAPAGQGRFRLDNGYWDVVGPGGVLTTVEDLARWQVNFETARVGGPAFVDAMLRPGRLSDGTPLQYASALMLRTVAGQPAVLHRGMSGAFRTELMGFPARKFHVICTCNHAEAKASILAERVAGLWIERAPYPAANGRAAPEPEAAVAARAGLYRNPVSGAQVLVVARGASLLFGGASGKELVHQGGNEYAWPDAAWAARLVVDGATLRFTPILGRTSTWERFEPVRPSAAELHRLVGRYWSPELDVDWEIAIDGGRPSLRIRSGPPRRLAPGAPGEFLSEGVVLRFEPGTGPAPGFTVFSGTVHDLPFERVTDRPAATARAVAPATRR